MSTSTYPGGRVRAYLEFVAAVIYYFMARSIAHHAAAGLVSDAWAPLVQQAMFAFLLIVAYALFGTGFDREKNAVSEQGFPLRPDWEREAGLGIAIGWAAAVGCGLVLSLAGGIAIVLSTQLSAWGWLVADAAFFALAALAEEVAFRGYGFQRFIRVVGPLGASLGFAAFYGIVQAMLPGSSHLSIAVSVVFSFALSIAYLRSRALWLSWGLNFGWKASRALIFGLTVSGVSSHSSVIEGDPMGSFYITGGGFGLDGSWTALVILLITLVVVYRVTRNLDFRYNAPVIVPGGIPVDIDAASRLQHEAAMGPTQAPAAPSLVQILPVYSPPASNLNDGKPKEEESDTRAE